MALIHVTCFKVESAISKTFLKILPWGTAQRTSCFSLLAFSPSFLSVFFIVWNISQKACLPLTMRKTTNVCLNDSKMRFNNLRIDKDRIIRLLCIFISKMGLWGRRKAQKRRILSVILSYSIEHGGSLLIIFHLSPSGFQSRGFFCFL